MGDLFAAGPFISGLLLGTSLIIAIGAQNAFVLRQGLLRRHVFIITTICFLSDAALITAGILGLGTLIQNNPDWLAIVAVIGGLFLLAYGALAFKRALHASSLKPAEDGKGSLSKVVLITLALTWGNPHVYLDTVVLIGGLSAQYPGAERLSFGLGAILGSALWFFSLGFGARYLAPLFARPIAWRILDLAIAVVMWALAYSLLRSLV
jgi:L-lysine exporter family protein LysE/ArgO